MDCYISQSGNSQGTDVKALFALVLLAPLLLAEAGAAQLLMLEQPGCPWCRRFNEEIAPAYPRTEEGQRAPLRRIDITEPWPADLDGVTPDRMTPTFVLIHEGEEIARMRGYAGDEFFWVLLGEMLAKLPAGARM